MAKHRETSPILEPLAVERLRVRLGRRGATLVSMLAYGGLRPTEALALRWHDVSIRSLAIRRSASVPRGERRLETPRTVRLLEPVAADLAGWRAVTSHPGPRDLVFSHRVHGPFTELDWERWERKVFAVAAARAGLPARFRPVDLRHTLAALLIDEGVPVVSLARELGQAPLGVWSMYRPLLEERHRLRPRPANEAIVAAREELAGRRRAA